METLKNRVENMIHYWHLCSKMMMNIWFENKFEIHLISIVGVGNSIESNAYIAKRQKNWYLFEMV